MIYDTNSPLDHLIVEIDTTSASTHDDPTTRALTDERTSTHSHPRGTHHHVASNTGRTSTDAPTAKTAREHRIKLEQRTNLKKLGLHYDPTTGVGYQLAAHQLRHWLRFEGGDGPTLKNHILECRRELSFIAHMEDPTAFHNEVIRRYGHNPFAFRPFDPRHEIERKEGLAKEHVAHAYALLTHLVS